MKNRKLFCPAQSGPAAPLLASPSSQSLIPPAGRGASPSANPCSSVRRHHVLRPERTLIRPDMVPHPLQSLMPPPTSTTSERTFLRPDVVPHPPQTLVPSSGSTTSIVRAEPPATRTWCFTVRKALFLRSEAPRLSSGPSLRRPGRGASPSAKPYSFVRKHHVLGPERTVLRPDVVPHPLQSLMPPSGGTMSIGRAEPPATRTWCFTIRKALFLRPETPRHLGPIEPPAAGAWCFTVRKALFLRPEAPRP